MEAKVIRSGEKNFEHEKTKIFEPKTLNKEEQLRLVFKNILYDVFGKYPGLIDNPTKREKDYIEEKTNELIKEVKIRTKL